MRMIEFVNPHPYQITLVGPDGKIVKIPKSARVVLSEYFLKYQPKFLQPLRDVNSDTPSTKSVNPHASLKKNRGTIKAENNSVKKRKEALKIMKKRRVAGIQNQKDGVRAQPVNRKKRPKRRPKQTRLETVRGVRRKRRKGGVVGRAFSGDATDLYKNNLGNATVPISNNIGVGILSYNRLSCIKRLLESIRSHTDLSKTTIFVSDESTDEDVKNYLRNQQDIVLIDNSERLGIAGNTNRLLNCLRRFRYKILLNDDVEILSQGWENFYVDAMNKTGYHHFCYRQYGIYGAARRQDKVVKSNGVNLKKIIDKPHGAVMVFDDIAFDKVGYFDEIFDTYGMEHVDWSNRVALSNIQPQGFYDVAGSHKYFKIYNECSSTNKQTLKPNRDKYNSFKDDKNRVYISPSDKCNVQEISAIIPCRAEDRDTKIIETVVLNMKGQLFPHIDIILVEQDVIKKCDYNNIRPCTHILKTGSSPNQPFTKSIAFNHGAAKAQTERLILQDADCIVKADYVKRVDKILDEYEGCHIGKYVTYLNNESTKKLIVDKKLSDNAHFERAVNYFEGGSLACRRHTYFKVGGFNDMFIGYGCFSGNAKVLMADGTTKPIKNVKRGDFVVTHTGDAKLVTNIMSRKYSGHAYELQLIRHSNEKTLLTPEHPIMASNGTSMDWIAVEDLKRLDYIERRRSHNIIDDVDIIDILEELGDKYIDVDGIVYPTREQNNKRFIDGRSIGLQRFIRVDNNFLDLLGYYAAEGCASPKNGIRFTIHEDELKEGQIGHEICRILNKYDLTCRINQRGNSKGRDIQTFCVTLANLLKKWFPDIKNDKRFPDWVMKLPPKKQIRILHALLRGDSQLRSKKNSIVLRMGNENLVNQAMFMAERCGIESTHCSPSSSNRYINYSMIIPHSELTHELADMLNINKLDKKGSYEHEIDGTVTHKIRNINKVPYNDLVYNITVDGDHSYIVNGMVVKNCEDCDFFQRLKDNSKFFNDRSECLIHLWHGRSDGWDEHHRVNKQKMSKFYGRYDRDKTSALNELRNKLRIHYSGVMNKYGL